MHVPSPLRAVMVLSQLIRRAMADVGAEHGSPARADRQGSTLIAGARAPFATTSYARARLLRQLHASGLPAASTPGRQSLAQPVRRPPQPLEAARRP
jgi:hypothetical protein